MTDLARKTGTIVVAERIETDAELAGLRRPGVGCGQGYVLGRPGTLEQALARASATPPIGDAA
jgi:EAL domain-containing protein (putative c-di-GMP-specific phosphodiesterase class I)